MNKKKFKGKLAARIEPRLLGGVLFPDDEEEEKIRKWNEEDNEKIQLLMEHYGVEAGPNSFKFLVLALARDFVPGFQEKRKKGRKTKWTVHRKGLLTVEIERLIENNKAKGVSEAAKVLSKIEPWSSFLEEKISNESTPDPQEVLRNMYFESKDETWAKVAREAFLYHEHTNSIEEWNKSIEESLLTELF
jgi:hypothetical protein